MEAGFPADNPLYLLVHSGAAGNMMQVRQLAGMKGLVANPKGEIIPRPIKTNFREGCPCWSTSSPRTAPARGWPTPALRTADFRVPHPGGWSTSART